MQLRVLGTAITGDVGFRSAGPLLRRNSCLTVAASADARNEAHVPMSQSGT
jgi:hypothetical protein